MTTHAGGAISTVLYANTPSFAFDMDYYTKTHMPLCMKIWGPHGLLSWQVMQCDMLADESRSRPPFAVQAILQWSKLEDMEVLKAEKSKVIFDDVKEYCNEDPVFMIGNQAGAGAG